MQGTGVTVCRPWNVWRLCLLHGDGICALAYRQILEQYKDNPNSVPQKAFKSVRTHFRLGTQITAAYCTTVLLKCMQKSVQAQLSPLKTGESMEYQILCLGGFYFISFMLIAFSIGKKHFPSFFFPPHWNLILKYTLFHEERSTSWKETKGWCLKKV